MKAHGMRRTEHLGARALSALGLVATAAYLVWRICFSLQRTNLLLSLPTLALEITGLLGAGALVWALWPAPQHRSQPVPAPAGKPTITSLDAVLRVDEQDAHEVRASLLALRSVHHLQDVVVLDLSARPVIAGLATEFQAVYAASDTNDRNGLRVALAAVRTPSFLLLDAGDIPTADIIVQLSAGLADPKVGVVQGLGASFAEDSAEHGPNGQHELHFERASLNPALGRRGSGIWLGTGSLVRTDALREARVGTEPSLEAQWLAGLEMLAAGWTVVAPSDVAILAHRTEQSEAVVAQDRVHRARTARRMVFGRRGVLRAGRYTVRQRLSVLAWSVRPLSGLRRSLFVGLLAAAVLAGSVPFHAPAAVLISLWLPGFLYTSLGLALLSGWALRPGDRARWSLHTMGAALVSLRRPRPVRHDRRKQSPVLTSSTNATGLVGVVVLLSAVLVARGLSDRLTHTLPAMRQTSLMLLLTVCLWVLALSLDLLRVLARRNQMRRTARVVSSLAATLGERAVSIVDLTPLGAGLISQTGVDVHERLLLDSAVPTRTGVTTMRVTCAVRNVHLRSDGDYRIGVEFGGTDDATANALAEFCVIEPAWERLGVMPGRSITEARQILYVDEPEGDASRNRVIVRLLSLLALVGAIGSSVSSTADASPALDHRITGAVVAVGDPPVDPGLPVDSGVPIDTAVDSSLVETNETFLVTTTTAAPTVESGAPIGVPGAVVTGICSLDPGADGVWGTADDVYSTPVATVTDSAGGYTLNLQGEACWATVDPPDGYDPTAGDSGSAPTVDTGDAPVPQPVDVSGRTTTNHPVVFHPTTPAAAPGADAAIGDTVWSDSNGNGLQDAGEPGLAGVLITLFDDHGHRLAGTTSDAAGGFLFDHLAGGSYQVGAANLPDGFVFTDRSAGSDPASDSDVNPVTGRSAAVTVAAGELAAVVDIGLTVRQAPPASATATPLTRQVLPAPADSQLAKGISNHSDLSILVLILAALLGLSILLGLARPRLATAR